MWHFGKKAWQIKNKNKLDFETPNLKTAKNQFLNH